MTGPVNTEGRQVFGAVVYHDIDNTTEQVFVAWIGNQEYSPEPRFAECVQTGRILQRRSGGRHGFVLATAETLAAAYPTDTS